jgi:hypothetical protein
VGATTIKETRTPKGEAITIDHDKGITTISELTSLVTCVVNMDIMLTISPKLLITNG